MDIEKLTDIALDKYNFVLSVNPRYTLTDEDGEQYDADSMKEVLHVMKEIRSEE